MKLTLSGIQQKESWQKAGIILPSYDVEAVQKQGRVTPVWLHFGIGNIFRIFIGAIADKIIANGSLKEGLICAETYDYEIVDKIFRPYDNLMLSVILNNDGTTVQQVLAPFAEAVKADCHNATQWQRLKEVFASPSLQMVSFTITEKGYALKGTDGSYTPLTVSDIEGGPEHCSGAMAVVTAMLYERYKAGGKPLALVSMDNCSHNGQRLQEAVQTLTEEWLKKGFVEVGFRDYVHDDKTVAFPWTMIDKITPRPSEKIASMLEKEGVEDMKPLVTKKKTFIAPFGNAEEAQYLVIEDHFPNGRPPLEEGGVYMTDRETVNKAEKMKVNTCLNPIHTALCTYDCMLGYDLFADGMADPELSRLAHQVGYVEGLPVVADPGIISPKAFLDEVVNVRMSNPYLGDTSQRIATDISHMVGIRFGETIKSYVAKDGTAAGLIGIPLAIVGWLRYLLAVDDQGKPFELAPDPMIPEMQQKMQGIEFGKADSLQSQLKPILSNANIFGIDLYQAGLGEKCEEMFRQEIAGTGAVRRTLKKYLDQAEG
jgi:fructuronate reductase